jgi:hypothetical protein
VVCRHGSRPHPKQVSRTVAAAEQVPQTLATAAERVAQTLVAVEPVKLLVPTTKPRSRRYRRSLCKILDRHGSIKIRSSWFNKICRGLSR